MTTTMIGVAATVLAVVFVWRNFFPKLRLWLALGGGLMAGSGLVYTILHTGLGWITKIAGVTSGKLFGVAAGGLIVLIVVGVLLYEAMHPKNGTGGHRFLTPILAFVFPAILLGGGGIFAQSAGLLHQGVSILPAMTSGITN